MIQFTIRLPPAGQGRARSRAVVSGNPAFASTYKARKDRLKEAKLLELARPYAPAVPLDEPLLLGVQAVLPIPKGKPKRWRAAAAAGEEFPTVKPDLDNIVKLVKDALNGVFWTDDKIIVGYLGFPHTAKVYGEVPQYTITIEPARKHHGQANDDDPRS